MDGLVAMALKDWARVKDEDLIEVCARARILAAMRTGNFPATTADVLRAHQDISEAKYMTRFQREQEAREALIRSGKALPEPTITEMSEEGRNAFFESLYKAVGAKKPGTP